MESGNYGNIMHRLNLCYAPNATTEGILAYYVAEAFSDAPQLNFSFPGAFPHLTSPFNAIANHALIELDPLQILNYTIWQRAKDPCASCEDWAPSVWHNVSTPTQQLPFFYLWCT